jgi:hypothetical protein
MNGKTISPADQKKLASQKSQPKTHSLTLQDASSELIVNDREHIYLRATVGQIGVLDEEWSQWTVTDAS